MLWNASVGRITLFPAPEGGKQSAQDIFRVAFGKDPAGYAVEQSGASTARGEFNSMRCNCAVQLARIDLTLTPLATSPLEIALIKSPLVLKSSLEMIVRAVSDLKIPATRVAVSMQLTRIVPSNREGNETILSVLPSGYALPLKDETDVVLQINHRQTSAAHPDVKLNFLTKWTVDDITVLALPVAGQPGVEHSFPAGIESLVRSYTAVNVLFDNNTAPRSAPLTHAQASATLPELLGGMPTCNGVPIKFEET